MRANSRPASGTRRTSRLTTRRRKRMPPRRRRSLRTGSLVPDAMHRRDRIATGNTELGADPADVGVDGSFGNEVVVPIRALHELTAREDDSRTLEQRPEHAELRRRQRDGDFPVLHFVSLDVELDPGMRESGLLGLFGLFDP